MIVQSVTGNLYDTSTEAIPDGPDQDARALLDGYGEASDEDSAREILGTLFERFAHPWCQEITGRAIQKYGLRSKDAADQSREIEAEVLLKLTARLRATRVGDGHAISDLRAYIASCVYNACFMRLRAATPERARLENRLRYLLRNHTRLALWDAGGQMVAGLKRFQGTSGRSEVSAPQQPSRDLEKLVDQVFRQAQGPVPFASVVAVVGSVLGIEEVRHVEFDDTVVLTATEERAEDAIGRAQRLRALWLEVTELPRNQKLALLLNLRDDEGQGVIELITATGVAPFDKLATALHMSEQDLEQIWDDLPLPDEKIAELLDLTRQQVINLRKSARARLSRRMTARDNPRGNSASAMKGSGLAAPNDWGGDGN